MIAEEMPRGGTVRELVWWKHKHSLSVFSSGTTISTDRERSRDRENEGEDWEREKYRQTREEEVVTEIVPEIKQETEAQGDR